MTFFLDVHGIRNLVQDCGAGPLMQALTGYIEADYLRWPEFDKRARIPAHCAQGVIELMPVADSTRYAFKYITGHPGNPETGKLTVAGFGVLADLQTGYPLLFSEMTISTALRTAATSVLAARLLARPGARSMAIIGNGAQSDFQVLAFHHVLGVTTFYAYDVDRAATDRLIANMAQVPGITIHAAESAADAVRHADIITTVTADLANATILTPEMIRPGMHVNAVGGDSPGKTELHPDILLRDDARVVVEYTAQSRVEGEIQQLPADFPVTELHALVDGSRSLRKKGTEVTIFDSVGFALQDFSTLRYLYDVLRTRGDAPTLALVPVLDDPKDLFGFMFERDEMTAIEQS